MEPAADPAVFVCRKTPNWPGGIWNEYNKTVWKEYIIITVIKKYPRWWSIPVVSLVKGIVTCEDDVILGSIVDNDFGWYSITRTIFQFINFPFSIVIPWPLEKKKKTCIWCHTGSFLGDFSHSLFNSVASRIRIPCPTFHLRQKLLLLLIVLNLMHGNLMHVCNLMQDHLMHVFTIWCRGDLMQGDLIHKMTIWCRNHLMQGQSDAGRSDACHLMQGQSDAGTIWCKDNLMHGELTKLINFMWHFQVILAWKLLLWLQIKESSEKIKWLR